MLDKFKQRSEQAHSHYRQERTKVTNDKHLSDEGKRAKLAELKANYDRQVAAIRDEATQELAAARPRHQKAVQDARAKSIDAKRAVLGDVVFANIVMRELDTMNGANIQRWFEEAAPGFERELVGLYGSLVVEQRIAQGNFGDGNMAAHSALTQADPDDLRQAQQALQDLDNAERRLDELDRESYNNALADRMGVNARYMETE